MNLLMSDALEHHWAWTWGLLGLPPSPELYAWLCRSYAEPHRKYHTQQHLSECLALCEQDGELAQRPGEVAIALWFHDAIYRHGRNDNELASADWAHRALLMAGLGLEAADRVHALVMATCHTQAPVTPDEQLLVDIDLSILGAGPSRFAEYQQQIRDEYAHVPQELFSQKRREVLRAFMAREQIYCTAAYRQRLEARARDNLRLALGGEP